MSHPKKTFEHIYNQYIDKIYRFVFIKVSSRETAEDLCSETFSRFWQELKQGKNIENPCAFLYHVARNLIIDHYRTKPRIQLASVEGAQIIDPGVNLEQEQLLKSDLDTIKAGLARLKQDEQDIIIWRYLDELSIPEIAKMLDKTETAVRVALHRALKTLKLSLSDV
jgi:RNA polymerase sigma-70 factor (ECF subfamily)